MTDPLDFFNRQLQEWPLAGENYSRLNQALTRPLKEHGLRQVLQFNPGRMASTAADTHASVIKKRPCFLCEANRPPEQRSLPVPGDPQMTLLVNPFPVFPRHFTIISKHEPQRLIPRLETLFRLARWLDHSVLFYNGAKCGASAPDHLHFQAGNKGLIPFETDIDTIRERNMIQILSRKNAVMYQLNGLSRGGWFMEGKAEETLLRFVVRLMETLQTNDEPMVNLLCWYDQQGWHLVLFYRKAHRPSCYFLQDEHQRLISPAAVEMGGLIIAARQEDFDTLSEAEAETLFREVSWDDATVTRSSNRFLHCIDQPGAHTP